MAPVFGSNLPMVPLLLPVYQTLPALSRVTLCGKEFSGNGYSFMASVLGSMRPIRLPHCPAHQMDPSAACIGSRERCPSVGTRHSLNAICMSPGISVGAREVLGGKCVARYCVILSWFSGVLDRSIIVPVSSFQPARV